MSTSDQHVESQLYDLRELAEQRGVEVVQEYQDCRVSGERLDPDKADRRVVWAFFTVRSIRSAERVAK